MMDETNNEEFGGDSDDEGEGEDLEEDTESDEW